MATKDELDEDRPNDQLQPRPKKRRRVPEACHVCRRRKAKCDGGRPCSYCKMSGQECIFDPSHPVGGIFDKNLNGSLQETIRNLQERVRFLESKAGAIGAPLDVSVSNSSRAWNVVQQNIVQQRAPQDNNTLFLEFNAGVSTINSGTRNVEFYGATSSYAFAAARALFPNTNAHAKITPLSPSHNSPASSKESPDNASKFVSVEDTGMEELLASNDTPMPDQLDGFMSTGPSLSDAAITLQDPFLQRRDMLDRHIDSFFSTAYTLLPILHEGAFRKLYDVFWKEVERKEYSRGENEIGRDALDAGVMPLVFAVACHGALYSADTDDQREWARGYFARARRWLSVFETGSFENMIAMYLLAIYAQHVFKMNLAYNYLGLAIRLSYSIGLHVFNGGTSEKTIATAACWPGVSRPIIGEMAKRIWWSMYALEVESSLNCGRPMCIRNQDIFIGDPTLLDDNIIACSDTELLAVSPNQPTLVNYLIEMAQFSRIVRKFLKVSYSAQSTKLNIPVWTEELHKLGLELAEWREALPIWLRTTGADALEEPFWMTRQRESIQYHYNHVLITMYRDFLNIKKPFSHPKLSSETGVQRCVEAARGNIVLIHDCLDTYPSLPSLVFIDRLNQAPFDPRALDYTRCCALAADVFDWMRPLGGTDKYVSIIKKCLEEWKKRRETKAATGEGRQQPSRASVPETDVETPGTTEQRKEVGISASQNDTPSSERSMTPSISPVQNTISRRPVTSGADSVIGQQILQHPDSSNSPFVNSQFIPDIYFASNGLAFNHGNPIALVPNSPYDSIGTLLNADFPPAAAIHQSSTSQITVANTARLDNRTRNREDDNRVANVSYNPNERIERMFGINPPWRG